MKWSKKELEDEFKAVETIPKRKYNLNEVSVISNFYLFFENFICNLTVRNLIKILFSILISIQIQISNFMCGKKNPFLAKEVH